MNKLQGKWRLNKIEHSNGSVLVTENMDVCGINSHLFGILCKWRWEIDDNKNVNYTICQDLSDTLCSNTNGKFEIIDNNNIVFHGSIFTTAFGYDSLLTIEELTINTFKIGATQSATTNYKDIFEFNKIN